MKIAVICDVLGKINNGTTMAAYNLINHLKSAGHEIVVICPDKDKKGLEGFVILKTRYIPFINEILARNGIKLAWTNRKLIEKTIKDCDVIHSILPFVSGHTALKVAKKYNIPMAVSFHCQAENVSCHFFMKNVKWVNRLIYKRFYRRVFKHVDAIHYPTEFIRNIFENVVGPTPGYVISNGANKNIMPLKLEKPEHLKNKFVLLSVGRLCNEKSHMLILKAVARSKYAKDIQLIFAGNGPLLKKIIKYSNKYLPVPPIIDFFAHEEMAKIFNYADLYIHPAEIELEGIACLEAIACGLVPIVSDSPKAATKKYALSLNNICKYNDPDSLKEKIEYWIEHPKERAMYQEKYLNFGTNLDRNCMAKMEQMLFDIIEKKAGTGLNSDN